MQGTSSHQQTSLLLDSYEACRSLLVSRSLSEPPDY